jgi:hypothetical protein
MFIGFSDLASEKYPVSFIRRLFKKLDIPGAVMSEDSITIPDTYANNPQTPECWTFTGAISRGYGSIKLRGKTHSVHRIMYDLWNHDLSGNLLVMHLCNNPKCGNWFHLDQGTYRDNMAQMVAQGRQAVGEQNGNHKLTSVQVMSLLDEAESKKFTQAQLAKKYGIGERGVRHILHGDCWKRERQEWLAKRAEKAGELN